MTDAQQLRDQESVCRRVIHFTVGYQHQLADRIKAADDAGELAYLLAMREKASDLLVEQRKRMARINGRLALLGEV